jgi:glycerol kinase
MQFQSDILGCPVPRNNSTVLSALGAAYVAGLTVGVWAPQDDIAALPRSIDRYGPRMTPAERESRIEGWQQAVARTLSKP